MRSCSLWLQEALQLQQWQKDKILEFRAEYLAGLADITKERQEVQQGLKVCPICPAPL